MASILTNLKSTIIASFILTLIMLIVVRLILGSGMTLDHNWAAFLFRWLHVLSGVVWVGLLYYFNFVQIPSMPNIPDEQKPAVTKVIAPTALWWFRWAAMATIVSGLILAAMNGYLLDAIMRGFTDSGTSTPIGIGMWLGAIMWFNVWFVIWPSQQKALGMVEVSDEEKTAAAQRALLFSRTNTL